MTLVWLGIAIILAFGIEAMTGFGSIVLALSLGALVMEIDPLVHILVPLNLLMTAPMTWRLRQHIQFRFLLRTVLPMMLTGTAIGVLLTPYLPELLSKTLFAGLIIWFAARALLQPAAAEMPALRRHSTITAAGITHGLFASGGPLLVYALARTSLDKTQFRATLLTVWLCLNGCLTIYFLQAGELAPYRETLLWLAPCVGIGAWVGNRLHHRIDQAHFSKLVFGVLLAVGLILMLNTLLSWAAAQH
ncbi:sulfite exporter TauE/SafE family protein [Photobacterium sp. TLY01]|uniref:sulfite exporter TauE/SafE family protein n=1 Tax=Photobacterium sp. TLY01 TaxID=2907534 RepID=UPI001F489468|nr:sulfite exporter TauE/SafE family protein [Photobacterium sp. TLY01]UIP28133.1 sulfite exporter TauE/SafE family protein [Photobacterium sp. TLY01]